MNTVEFLKWLDSHNANLEIRELIEKKLPRILGEVEVSSDEWDLKSWVTNMKNYDRVSVYFGRIQQIDLKLTCKVMIVEARVNKNISSASFARQMIVAFCGLADVLGARKFSTLKTDDFFEAEKIFAIKYSRPYDFASSLQRISQWLSLNFFMRLDYVNRFTSHHSSTHGRKGTDEGREEKLISIDIIRQMLEAKNRTNLSESDKFFISVFAIALGTGFRIGELSTLPAECKLKNDGALYLLHFPGKGGKPIPRPIHPKLSDVVETAVDEIYKYTEGARCLAKKLYFTKNLNWRFIVDDEKALLYFTQKWAHDWTANPEHALLNSQEIWSTKLKRNVDVIKEYSIANENKTIAAKNLGMSRQTFSNLFTQQNSAIDGELDTLIRGGNSHGLYRTDWFKNGNYISYSAFQEHIGLRLSSRKREIIKHIILEAQILQLKGSTYPSPNLDESLESKFFYCREPLLKTKSGKVLLFKDEALFLINKGALSQQKKTKANEYYFLSDNGFRTWLAGSSRNTTNKQVNNSVFSRLEIIDPRNGEVARFTPHDIRHWLNTVYQNGGLTEDQIALLFNRKYKNQNATYDQTTNKFRVERLKETIRDGSVIGQINDSYHRIAEYSREEAEEYLSAAVRMANPMPHGICMLSWATTPCPHHLSCFSCDDEKPCVHLIIDPSDETTTRELNRLKVVADLTIDAIESQSDAESPSVVHFQRISRNIRVTLESTSSRG